MTIIRNKRSRNFTTIPNDIINDPALYWQDLGLVVFLLSKPDSWFIRPDILAKEKNLRINGIYEILKRLRASGYARLTRYPSGATEWTIYDEPQSENHDEASPHHENPNEAFPREAFPREDNHDVYVNTDKAVKTDIRVNNDVACQQPTQNNPKKDETPRRRKTDLKEFPDPFLITDEMFEFSAQKGFSYEATIELTREFKDYHLSKGTKFIDWNRAWNNWIRKAVVFKQRGFK